MPLSMNGYKEGGGIENFTFFVRERLPALPPIPEGEAGEQEEATPSPHASQEGSPSSPLAPLIVPSSAAAAAPNPTTGAERGHSPLQDSSKHGSHVVSRVARERVDVSGNPSKYNACSNSSGSTSGTDYYPSSGPLLRKVDDGEAPLLTPRPEELPHLHDFLLQSTASSLSVTAKWDGQGEFAQAAQQPCNDYSTTQPPCSSEMSGKASPSAQSRSVHESEVLRRQQQQQMGEVQQPVVSPSPPVIASDPLHSDAAPTAGSSRPVRHMVRRIHLPPPGASPNAPAGATTTTQVAAFPAAQSPNSSSSATAANASGVRAEGAEQASAMNAVDASFARPPRQTSDLLSPTYPANGYRDIDAAAHAATLAAGAGVDLPIRETFPIPRYCPDDLLRGEDKLWCPGKPLRIAYVTWNMANKPPRMEEVSAYCIHPNAHLVVVGTQENGPYVGSNAQQKAWAKAIGDVCLGNQYELVGEDHMWAVQMLVFARKRDVAKYVSRAHASHVKTGMLCGWGGNKGGVAVGLVLSLTPKFVEISHAATTHRAVTTAPPTPRGDHPLPVGAGGAAAPGMGPVTLPRVLPTDAALLPPVEVSDDVKLSPSAVAGPSPPALLDASVMRHDIDDDDAQVFQGRGLAATAAPTVAAVETRRIGRVVDDDDGVFSPAEMLSRNASFDLSRERQRRRKQKKKLGHSFKRKDRADAAQASDDDESDGTPDTNTPNYMSLLFVTAHLAAHQGAVVNRNKDYRQIVHSLKLGRRGPYRTFFKRLLKQRAVLGADMACDPDADNWDHDSSEDDVTPLSLPVVSAIVNRGQLRRDVTEEFDLTFFGGDLNYRINGTRKAIEYVIQHHRNIRSILINNDQLSLERARGTVFQGYQEGNLLFRPTYKYEVSPSNGGVTLDDYNFSRKKDRMPAYCDRVLFKKKASSAARRVAIRLYTDVPNVRTSDHRPVVALFDVGTRAYTT